MRRHVTIYPEVKWFGHSNKTHIEGKEIKNMEFTEIIKNHYKTIYFIYGRITKHQIGGCI